MKTKLHKRNFEESLKKTRTALNETVFFKDMIPKGKATYSDVADKLSHEFLESSQEIGFFGKREINGVKNPDQYFFIKFEPEDSKEYILKQYLKFFAESCPTGLGFTPRLAMSSKFSRQGYNCFGKAMAFASFAMFHNIGTDLAFSTDHAMCICYDGNKMYLCDPGSGSFWKMNGIICEHDEYGWYRKVSSDSFRFNYLVVRDVSFGGFYAMMRTFEFLKKTPWDHTVVITEQDPSFEIELLGIMNPKLPYRKCINAIDWTALIQEFFPLADNYEREYRKEWLLETEFVRQWRLDPPGKSSFDTACFNAIRATHFTGTFREFNQQNIPIMRIAPKQVLEFLEQGREMSIMLPQMTMTYLRILQEAFSKDKALKDYGIGTMHTKLLDTTVNY